MACKLVPHATKAESLDDGVVITFEDGKCAFFSDALLHSTLSFAEELSEPEDDEDEPHNLTVEMDG